MQSEDVSEAASSIKGSLKFLADRAIVGDYRVSEL